MQPGSLERIEYYRQKADAEEPLFEGAPAGIPILPRGEMFCRNSPEKEKAMNLDEAIDLLTSDDAAAAVTDRIAHHQTEIAKHQEAIKKLKRLPSALQKRSPQKYDDPELEKQVLTALRTNKRPMSCKELGAKFGVSFVSIGRLVASSSELTKEEGLVVLTEG